MTPINLERFYVTIHNEQGPASYGPFLTEAAVGEKVAEVLKNPHVSFDFDFDRIYVHSLHADGSMETTEMGSYEIDEILEVSDTGNELTDFETDKEWEQA